jgi:Family of unknown function (DUF6035)
MSRGDLGIRVLYDSLTGRPVEARLVLFGDDNEISRLRDRVHQERKAKSSRYCCGLCLDPVYVSNSSGTPHFAHYADSGPDCPWRAELTSSFDHISALRFGGKQEGETHKRLLRTLWSLCQRSRGFSEVGIPNATFFGLEGTGHRFPDLTASYEGRRVVFELQVSKTYLPVISDREAFYRQNGIYLFWLFYNFEQWRDRQTERDIIALRGRQAFELDDEAIKATLDSGSLTLKAHWQVPNRDGDEVRWRWEARLIRFEELTFVEALVARPWDEEITVLRDIYADRIVRFERFWITRVEWSEAQYKRLDEQRVAGKPVDDCNRPDKVIHRAFESLLKAAGAEPLLASNVQDLKFGDLLDRLMFLRDGINRFNRQDLAGATDTVLENWPHFTDAVFSVALAYGHRQILRRENVRRKIARNLLGEGARRPVPQSHEFDRLIALFCPRATGLLRVPSTGHGRDRIAPLPALC